MKMKETNSSSVEEFAGSYSADEIRIYIPGFEPTQLQVSSNSLSSSTNHSAVSSSSIPLNSHGASSGHLSDDITNHNAQLSSVRKSYSTGAMAVPTPPTTPATNGKRKSLSQPTLSLQKHVRIGEIQILRYPESPIEETISESDSSSQYVTSPITESRTEPTNFGSSFKDRPPTKHTRRASFQSSKTVDTFVTAFEPEDYPFDREGPSNVSGSSSAQQESNQEPHSHRQDPSSSTVASTVVPLEVYDKAGLTASHQNGTSIAPSQALSTAPATEATEPLQRQPRRRISCGSLFSCFSSTKSPDDEETEQREITIFETSVIVRKEFKSSGLQKKNEEERYSFGWKRVRCIVKGYPVEDNILGTRVIFQHMKSSRIVLSIDIASRREHFSLKSHSPMDNSISLIDNHHSTSYIIHTSSIRDAHSLYLSLRSVLLPTASPPLPEHFEVAIPEWSLVIQIPLRNPKITMDEIRTMCIESVDKMYENDPEELPIWNRWKSTGELRMSWRRGERLEWVFDDNTAVMCPRLLEKTHALELRKARSPKVCLEGKFISKPLQMEGFLKMATPFLGTSRVRELSYYFTLHNNFLFYLRKRHVAGVPAKIDMRASATSELLNTPASSPSRRTLLTDSGTEYFFHHDTVISTSHVHSSKGVIDLLDAITIEIPGSCSQCHMLLHEFMKSSHTLAKSSNNHPHPIVTLTHTLPATNSTPQTYSHTSVFIIHLSSEQRVQFRAASHDHVHSWVHHLAKNIQYYRRWREKYINETNKLYIINKKVKESNLDRVHVFEGMESSDFIWNPDMYRRNENQVIKMATTLYQSRKDKPIFKPYLHILTKNRILYYSASHRTNTFHLRGIVCLTPDTHVYNGQISPETGLPVKDKHRVPRVFGAKEQWGELLLKGTIDEEVPSFSAGDDEDTTTSSDGDYEDIAEVESEEVNSTMDSLAPSISPANQSRSAKIVPSPVSQETLTSLPRSSSFQSPHTPIITPPVSTSAVTFSLLLPPSKPDFYKRLRSRGVDIAFRGRCKREKQLWICMIEKCIEELNT